LQQGRHVGADIAQCKLPAPVILIAMLAQAMQIQRLMGAVK
jgi:hypothetical protein